MGKTLKIAVQMDPIGSINIGSDSSFALMLEAQKRRHKLYYFTPKDLTLKNNEVFADIAAITLRDNTKDYFTLGKKQQINLQEFDVILMRQDPPFNLNYITYTHFLDFLTKKVMVINNPNQVRNCPEKLFVHKFAHFMPPTLITENSVEILQFLTKHKKIVLKPLYGHGGNDIKLVESKDGKAASIIAKYIKQYNYPVIAQKFLTKIAHGDKRVIMIDGKIAGAILRVPEKGNFLANMAQGGIAKKTKLTKKEQQICQEVGQELKKRQLLLAGLDLIGGYITEINITSPTGLRAIDNIYHTNTAAKFWSVVEKALDIPFPGKNMGF